MANKHKFLVPVAVAAAALLGSTKLATANTSNSPSSSNRANETDASATPQTQAMRVRTSPDRIDSFLLIRSDEGHLLAQHDSHYSHESHSSHSSHSSHYSAASLA